MAAVIDPEREIVDPHHHLWPPRGDGAGAGGAFPTQYLLDDLHADTGSGHRVTRTVFIECRAAYRPDGPRHLRPVGETEFVADVAEQSESTPGATVAGIVAHADLTLPPDELDEVLDGHEAAGRGRFRGIRDALSSAPPDVALLIPGRAAPDKAADPAFRRGVARLGERGLTYDTWQYHVQNRDFLELARAVPGTTMVFDHLGTPLGVGPWAGRHDEVFGSWKDDIAAVASCPNVVMKLGGMAMPDNGFGWHLGPGARPDAEAFVAAQERWYHHAIDCFGPDRCMFESNFPVDRASLDYDVLWNAFKLIAAGYDEAEQQAMFSGTATRVYGLDEP
jgi:predicted TIM-barrel fold metal-dependent hydrolase